MRHPSRSEPNGPNQTTATVVSQLRFRRFGFIHAVPGSGGRSVGRLVVVGQMRTEPAGRSRTVITGRRTTDPSERDTVDLARKPPRFAGGGLTVAQPGARKVVGRVGSPARERHPIHVAPTSRPGSGDAPTGVLRGTRFGCVPPVAPEHRWERGDRISDSAAIQDAWYVLARAVG